MSDFISRDKAIATVLGTSIEYQLIYGKKEPKEGFVRSLIKGIANIPQEETERKHGKWIKDGHHIQCDSCGMQMCDTDREGDAIPKEFCPNCGVRMDKKENE